MTDHNDTGAAAWPWREALRREPERYVACSPEAISHGSQAQMKYFVADAQHDIAILATCLAEVERERDEARNTIAKFKLYQGMSGPDQVGQIMVWRTQAEKFGEELDAAEARVAVLEKALAEVLDMYFPMSGPTAVKQPPLILEARTALAEQKEMGK